MDILFWDHKSISSLFEKTNPGFQKIALTDSLRLKRGGYLKNPVLAYETWGELSKEKDNIIVECKLNKRFNKWQPIKECQTIDCITMLS